MYRGIMLDIETMSLHPTHALVLSVGLLPFDMAREGFHVYRDEAIVVSPCVAEQLSRGAIVDAGTHEWWAKQGPAARAAWGAAPQVPLAGFAQLVRGFFADQASHERSDLWCKSPALDVSNLGALLGGEPNLPWHYRAVRDVRTVVNLLPEYRTSNGFAVERQLVAHNALDDCEYQVAEVWRHLHDDTLQPF